MFIPKWLLAVAVLLVLALGTWSFLLADVADGSTRVHLRVRGRMSPCWFAALYRATIVPADFVMGMGMLRGLRRRVVEPVETPRHRPA